MYLLITFQVTKDDITVAAKTPRNNEFATGLQAMAVLNEDENTGNKRTATKINALVERMPAMQCLNDALLAESTILATPTSFGEFLDYYDEFWGFLIISVSSTH